MNLKDTFSLGMKGIADRKLRTALTVLTIVIGIAAIVALTAVVGGISASISASLQSVGPGAIYLIPTGSHIFTDADVAVIASLPNVSSVTPMIRSSGNITVGGQSMAVTLIGINNYSLMQSFSGITFYSGGLYPESQVPYGIIGYGAAFPNVGQISPSVGVDQPVYITEEVRSGSSTTTKTVTVVPTGIMNQYGSSLFISPDTSVFIPLEAAEAISGRYSYNILLVQATNASTATPLTSLLNNLYGNEASILSVQQIAQTVAQITGQISLLLGAIAGISLIVAGISILSIMMVSVTERTHEIGVLKSIGFKKRDIMILFLSEAVIIGLLGGAVGTIAGTAAAYAIPALSSSHGAASPVQSGQQPGGAAVYSGRGRPSQGSGSEFQANSGTSPNGAASSTSGLSFTPVITPQIVGIAMFVSVIVSVISTAYPAWKASTVDPIKALRSE